jgi:hypothetical protein
LRIPCKDNIEGASAYVSISRAHSWHKISLLHELWFKNDDNAKFRYIQKATKSFAYDEDGKACKNILDRLAISTTSFFGENYLHYLTQVKSNICAICGAVASIMQKINVEAFMIVIIFEKKH